VSALLEEASETSDRATAKRTELFIMINDALTRHMRFEERHLYPALKKKRDTKDDALDAIAEHEQAKRLLRELSRLKPDDEIWKAKITVLQEDIRHHVKEEERWGGLFDDLAKEFDKNELVLLGERYQALAPA
jgi:iron-sulfur cluster repair protein YtfE (RIC family)